MFAPTIRFRRPSDRRIKSPNGGHYQPGDAVRFFPAAPSQTSDIANKDGGVGEKTQVFCAISHGELLLSTAPSDTL